MLNNKQTTPTALPPPKRARTEEEKPVASPPAQPVAHPKPLNPIVPAAVPGTSKLDLVKQIDASIDNICNAQAVLEQRLLSLSLRMGTDMRVAQIPLGSPDENYLAALLADRIQYINRALSEVKIANNAMKTVKLAVHHEMEQMLLQEATTKRNAAFFK